MPGPQTPEPPRRVAVVGIGADGLAGLSDAARQRLREAAVILGSARQLDLVTEVTAERIAWPSPLLPALPGLLRQYADRALCVLASGDPMFFGIGAALVREVGPDRVDVFTHPSSVSLACARLGWSWSDVDVVSLVGRSADHLRRVLQPGRRLLVLSADGTSPATVARLLTGNGYGDSPFTVLADLGGATEQVHRDTARDWGDRIAGDLNVIAVDCRAGAQAVAWPLTPGLPDEAFVHDGQLTKRDVRAVTLARLAPLPGQLLWDVGAGAGSIAIEWSRSHPSCRAIGIESRPERAERIARNAAELGVPQVAVVTGSAPEALSGLATPDAIFVGGGATVAGVIEACWSALAPGGRLVVNAVTLETERLVFDWYGRVGGELTRIAVSRAGPVGGFTAWRPALDVTQWTVTR
jgi:precorrin-6Y C5,15-methyltransferase (decarboxylating)